TAFVWCTAPAKAILSGISAQGEPVEILDRKKLHQPGGSLEILLVRSSTLQDGITCEIGFTLNSGDTVTTRNRAHLARWQEPDTARVLKVIASRFTTPSTAPGVIERFLAYVSAWQTRATVFGSFPEGLALGLPVSGVDGDATCYVATHDGLRRLPARLFCTAEASVAWIEASCPAIFYLVVGADLVRVDARHSDHGAREAYGARGASTIPRQSVQPLMAHVAATVTGPSATLRAWMKSQCAAFGTVQTDHVRIDYKGLVRIDDDHAALFLEATGSSHDSLSLTVTPLDRIEPVAVTPIVQEDYDADQGSWRRRVILVLSEAGEAQGLYRIDARSGDTVSSLWLHDIEPTSAKALALAESYAPLALLHDDVLRSVLHPILAAARPTADAVLAERMDVGVPAPSETAVIVFADGDREALHRTLIGLSLTSGEAFHVIVCVPSGQAMRALGSCIRDWSARYRLALSLRYYSHRLSEAEIAQSAFTMYPRRILLRAGIVPAHPAWLTQALERLAGSDAGVGLGLSETDVPDCLHTAARAWLEESGSPAGRNLKRHISAVAIADRPDGRSVLAGRLFSIEAYGLGLVLSLGGPGGEGDVPIVGVAGYHGQDDDKTFRDQVDLVSLNGIAGAG
ncbi:MAG: hypothetical protein ABW026_14590, partial [Microvirga sp.]